MFVFSAQRVGAAGTPHADSNATANKAAQGVFSTAFSIPLLIQLDRQDSRATAFKRSPSASITFSTVANSGFPPLLSAR